MGTILALMGDLRRAHLRGDRPRGLHMGFMPVPSAADLLKAQLRRTWTEARWVLDGIDRDDYLWEPAPLCWTVRRRAPEVEGWGVGEFVCEDGWPPPDPVPVPTIAWRVVHLAAWTDIYLDWTFGDAKAALKNFEVPGDVAGGLSWLYAAQDRFSGAVEGLGDEEAFDLRPAHWGESLTVAYLVTSMLTEHVHHIAEIGLLRDLRRGQARLQSAPAPIEGPIWRGGATPEASG